MRVVLQRVSSAGVTFVDESLHGTPPVKTGKGFALLVGICAGDDEKTIKFMAEKAANLRIFDDANGDLNLSILDISGECLVVPNFTLYASCRKGRRPSFTEAAAPEHSRPLFQSFVKALQEAGIPHVAGGVFGADMLVDIQNDGPVTIILDSAEIMPNSKLQ